MAGDRITIRLAELAKPLAVRLAETGETQNEYVRRLIAADLGIDPPEMRGQVKNLKQYQPNRRKKS